jgi:hypothetical protein
MTYIKIVGFPAVEARLASSFEFWYSEPLVLDVTHTFGVCLRCYTQGHVWLKYRTSRKLNVQKKRTVTVSQKNTVLFLSIFENIVLRAVYYD